MKNFFYGLGLAIILAIGATVMADGFGNAQQSSAEIVYDATPQLGGNLDTNNYCIANDGADGGAEFCDDILLSTGGDIANSVALTADVAPTAAYGALGGDASPQAVTGASQIGAASIWRGGCGTTNIKCVSAAGVVDDTTTVTLSGYTSAGAAWTQTFTADATDDDATDWVPGATEATCATNLAAVIDAGTVSGLYVDASAAGAGGVFVGIALKPGMNGGCPTIATNAAVGVLLPVNGTDGPLLVGRRNIGSEPIIASIADPTSGLGFQGQYTSLIASGVERVYASAAGGDVVGRLAVTTYVQAETNLLTGKSILPTVSAAATDVAPPGMVIATEEPYAATPPTTIPTNSAGSNLVLAPANGVRRLGGTAGTGMCTATPCVFAYGQTITIPVQVDGVTTNCVLTSAAATAAASREFKCDGETPAVCGANVVTAGSTVSPCSLLTITAANNVVSFARKSGQASYIGLVVSSAGGVTVQNGVDGKVVAPAGPGTGIPSVIGTLGNGLGLSWTATTLDVRSGAGVWWSSISASAIQGAASVVAGTFVSGATWVRAVTNATLGNCAAAGDVGKWLSYSKTDYTYPCFCEKTGAATYAWTPVTATGVAQGCN